MRFEVNSPSDATQGFLWRNPQIVKLFAEVRQTTAIFFIVFEA
jgi:hypothetical protein